MNSKTKTALPLNEAVSIDQSFVVFELSLTGAELTALENLKVSGKDSYDNFGAIELLENDTSRFLESIGNAQDESATAAKIIDKLSKKILASFKAEAAWITIRAFLPTTEYDIPRWHQDGRFYDTFDGKQKKATIALNGSSTLFKDASAALHSEPPIHTTRVFMSVVPGTKEQIEELRQRWKKKETSYTP